MSKIRKAINNQQFKFDFEESGLYQKNKSRKISEIYHLEKNVKQESKNRSDYANNNILIFKDRLKAWKNQEPIKMLPKSPNGKAMTYTINGIS